MVEKIDKETKATLLRALENAKAASKRLQENKEKRLWKKVDFPCSLEGAINRLTKNEMDKIRKNYDFRNLSSLNKADLASELAKLIPLKFKKVIYTLDQSRYAFIKAVVQNSGIISDMDISASNAEAFMEFSIVFPGLADGQRVLFMPDELINTFSQIDDGELKKIVERNTEWIRLTHGLLYYYGVMDPLSIRKRIVELTEREVDIMDFMHVMSFACDFYGQARYTSYGYQNDRVFNAGIIVEEHRMRSDVEYYPFTKKQLLEAGDPDYVDETPAMKGFISFLLEHYRLTEQETHEIALQIIDMINADSKPTLIIQYLQSWLEFPTFEFVQQVTAKLMELYNNTRQWVLKGHTPNELFQEEKKYLRPLPADPFKIKQQDSKAINQQIRAKVGRNDPCPCGSGRKYKKCCGGWEKHE